MHGLAQAHLVGQYAAEVVFLEKVQVGQALLLIAAQLGLEALGRGHGGDFPECVDLVAQGVPEGVRGRAGQIVEQAVQHRGLELGELLLGRLVGVEPQGLEFVRDALQPGFGQAAV